jgi:hypothetical protein
MFQTKKIIDLRQDALPADGFFSRMWMAFMDFLRLAMMTISSAGIFFDSADIEISPRPLR